MHESEEIYVIGPLGKIFVDADPVDVNKTLNFRDTKENPEYHEYREVLINDAKAQNVHLISTSRSPNRVLTELSIRLKAKLEVNNSESECFEDEEYSINASIGHTLFPFDDIPDERHSELIEEFPHRHTRKKSFMKNFFYVDC